MPFSDWWPFWGFSMFPLFFFAICIVILAFVVAPMLRGCGREGRSSAALDILNERLAKGEINSTEYEEKRLLMLS